MMHPKLFEEIQEVFSSYRKIKKRWDDERTRTYTLKRLSADKPAELYNHFLVLEVTARYAKIILSYVRALYDMLCGYAVKSEALMRLRTRCAGFIQSEAADELSETLEICEHYFAQAQQHDFIIGFDAELKVESCAITTKNVFQGQTEKKKFGLFGARKKEDIAIRYENAEELSVLNTDEILDFFIASVKDVDQILAPFAKRIYDTFAQIPSELDFYEVALLYLERMADKGAELCFPKMYSAEKNVLSCESLKDVLLVCECINPAAVIANDVDLHSGIEGMLIRGENNSGKTVYLRSIGTALIFAQAGLMIPAKSAEMSVRARIFTHFASAEEAGGSAGRFEQEVREIAEIVDHLVPGTLLFLNETFQTTSYDEGADGIYPILTYIRSLGGCFIFVTHLHHLFDLCEQDPGVTFRRTAAKNEPQYKIIQMK